MASRLSACLLLVGLVHLARAGNNTVTHEVTFEIVIQDNEGEDYKGKIVFGLFGHAAPASALNFASIATGYLRPHGHKMTYKSTEFHRVVPDFVIQGGDIDGVGGRSIYGHRFDDETFVHSHRAAGYVSWANHGFDTNGSQFFVTLAKARWLDGKHVVFAKVLKGMETIARIGEVPSAPLTSVPKKKIKVIDTYTSTLDKPYDISKEALDSDQDLTDAQKSAATPDEQVWAPESAKKSKDSGSSKKSKKA